MLSPQLRSMIGLIAIALGTLYGVAKLLFGVISLAPSSPIWFLVPVLAGFLAWTGAAVALQSWVRQQPFHGLLGMGSGFGAGAVLGFFGVSELSGQKWGLAVGGLVVGALLLASLAKGVYCRRSPSAVSAGLGASAWVRFGAQAIALISGLCAYGLAFGLGAWALAAFDTGHWGLMVLTGVFSALYLLCARRSLVVVAQYRA